MTAQPCRCEELEARLVKVDDDLCKEIKRRHELEAVVERMRLALVHLTGFCGNEAFDRAVKVGKEALSSPTLSSILARREAEKEVIEAARTMRDRGTEYLRDTLDRLDAQLEKEKP